MSIDLSTSYMGLKLKNPLVVSACPLTERLDLLRRFESEGASAVVLPSLFEEQITHDELEIDRLHFVGAESQAEALTYIPELEDYNTGPESYLTLIENARKMVSIPVIASLNGCTRGGWVRFARSMEDAGASAIELNVYYVAADANQTGEEVEKQYLDLIHEVRRAVSVPLAVKIGPYFSSPANMARKISDAGVDGIVLFNRFLQPDIDLDRFEVKPHLVFSSSHEMRLPLRWIAILKHQVAASLAATTGVHTALDVVKLLLVGADVVMVAASLYRHGPEYVRTLLDGLREWMREREYDSVEQLKGSMSLQNCPDPAGFERANYMRTLMTFTGESAV